MRTSSAIVLLLWFCVGQAADAPLPKEVADVQGVWKLVAGEFQGQPLDITGGPYTWVIEGNKITCGTRELGEFTLDAGKKPRTIDLSLLGPKRERVGIYELDGDTLRVCVNTQDGAKKRPTGLATVNQPATRLLFFQRVKGQKIDPVEGMRGFLGVSLGNNEEGTQVVIQSVVKDSPADKFGVKDGDVLLKVNAMEMKDPQDVIEAMKGIRPTSTAKLDVRRDGKDKTIEVKVGSFPFPLLD
jgi:uncharacterized protein (TIGR03067 family)